LYNGINAFIWINDKSFSINTKRTWSKISLVFFNFSYLDLNFFQTIINENEIFYTRQQELDVLLVELDRYLHNLTTNYETFESIHKDNRRELEIKLDKHQVK